MRSVCSVVDGLRPPLVDPRPETPWPLRRPGPKLALMVASMKDHTTDEGWQLALALKSAGFVVCGRGCDVDEVDVRKLLQAKPSVVVLQDKREWDVQKGDFRDPEARFRSVEALRGCGARVYTVLKDAHQRPLYHRESAEEIGCHGHLVYYHQDIVKRLAPYVNRMVRVYHTLDADAVPPFSEDRKGTLLSGAASGAYPLRLRLFRELRCDKLKHPGYSMKSCETPGYLRLLSKYRVKVCTSSVYGYALRKLMEATACGCAVVTDLPHDEELPGIDGNLHRVDSTASTASVQELCDRLARMYDADKQRQFAEVARRRYDYRVEGLRFGVSL